MNTSHIFSIVLCFIGFATLSSCGQESLTMSSNGYAYKIIPNGSGPQCAVGEFAIFDIDLIADNGKLIQSTKGYPEPPSFQVAEPGKTDRGKAPIEEVVALMNVGDSAVIYFPADSMDRKNPALAGIDTLFYCIKLRDAVTEESINEKRTLLQKEATEKQAAAAARFTEVEALSAKTYADYNAKKIDWQDGPEGLKYYIHEQGEGDTKAVSGDQVTCHYYGYNEDSGDFLTVHSKKEASFDSALIVEKLSVVGM